MKRETYLHLYGFLAERPVLTKTVDTVGRAVTLLIYAFYPVFLLILFWQKQTGWLKFFWVPFISFVAVSVFRHLLNAPRPYETFGRTPPIAKKTAGHSFPSRHTFSIFVIGFCTLPFCLPLGAVIVGLGILLAASRVLLGFHFLRDVLAGFVCAAAAYLVGFVLM